MQTIKNLLLVDDDDDDRSFFIEIAQEINPLIKITEANDGDVALCYLEKNRLNLPDIIFLDLNMPRVNGLECLERIKNNNVFQKIPVIIYSTTIEEYFKEKTYIAGASLFISKPNSMDDMTAVIKKIFSLKLQELLGQPPRNKFVITTTSFSEAG